MPSIRIGLSTQFNLENEQVGIGTTNPTEFLEVIGNIKAEGAAGGSGVSTFREYQGFHQSEQGIANNIVIDNQTGGPFSSLSADLVISGETTISSGSTVEIGKTKTLTVTDKFAVPFGDTNSRDSTPEAGTTRFNQDFGTLEFFDAIVIQSIVFVYAGVPPPVNKPLVLEDIAVPAALDSVRIPKSIEFPSVDV